MGLHWNVTISSSSFQITSHSLHYRAYKLVHVCGFIYHSILWGLFGLIAVRDGQKYECYQMGVLLQSVIISCSVSIYQVYFWAGPKRIRSVDHIWFLTSLSLHRTSWKEAFISALLWSKVWAHSQQLLTLSDSIHERVLPWNISSKCLPVLREATIPTSICGYAASARTHTHLRTHTHTHALTSIFKHAASAWRHDTTTSESKYIQGHSRIASHHMWWSHSPLSVLHSFTVMHNVTSNYIYFLFTYDWDSCSRSSMFLSVGFLFVAVGIWSFRQHESNISISVCWVVMSHCSCCCEQNS